MFLITSREKSRKGPEGSWDLHCYIPESSSASLLLGQRRPRGRGNRENAHFPFHESSRIEFSPLCQKIRPLLTSVATLEVFFKRVFLASPQGVWKVSVGDRGSSVPHVARVRASFPLSVDGRHLVHAVLLGLQSKVGDAVGHVHALRRVVVGARGRVGGHGAEEERSGFQRQKGIKSDSNTTKPFLSLIRELKRIYDVYPEPQNTWNSWTIINKLL